MHSIFMRALVAACISLAGAGASANSYRVIDLGREVQPLQIGNGGAIAGTDLRKFASGAEWTSGRWHRLPNPSGNTAAVAVNARGDVAGQSETTSAYDVATVWPRGGQPLQLQFSGLYPANSEATAIADDGSAAGWMFLQNEGTGSYCFVSGPDGVAVEMTFPNHQCSAAAMNNHGQVAGSATFDNGIWHAFLWQAGEFLDLGSLTTYSSAMAINDIGQVVGTCSYELDGQYESRAFLWSNGRMTELGSNDIYPSTIPDAINRRGEVVGQAYTPGVSSVAARFVGKKVFDLNAETINLDDWKLFYALGLNDEGVIVGAGSRADGFHAFMLVPVAHRGD